MPEWIVTYLNEQKVSSLTNAALLADKFILTHKSVFSSHNSVQEHFSKQNNKSPKSMRMNVPSVALKTNSHDYFYCHQLGHLIAACHV